jgi:hypothetical protein
VRRGERRFDRRPTVSGVRLHAVSRDRGEAAARGPDPTRAPGVDLTEPERPVGADQDHVGIVDGRRS